MPYIWFLLILFHYIDFNSTFGIILLRPYSAVGPYFKPPGGGGGGGGGIFPDAGGGGGGGGSCACACTCGGGGGGGGVGSGGVWNGEGGDGDMGALAAVCFYFSCFNSISRSLIWEFAYSNFFLILSLVFDRKNDRSLD